MKLVILAALALGLVYARSACAAKPAAEGVLYQNATVIDGTGAPAKATQDILVRDQRIVALARSGSMSAETIGSATKVDLGGRFVIPGLIDSHVHMATPPDRAAALALLRRDLYGGVTAVRDMADDIRAVAELARESKMEEIAAPDIAYAALMAGRPFFNDPRVHAASADFVPGTAPWMQAVDDHTDLKEAVTLARGTSATAIKIYADLPPSLTAAIAAEAHRQGLLVWTHSAIFPTRPSEVIAAGPDTVSHVCYLAYELQAKIPDAYEDHTPVNETLMTSDHPPVLAALFEEMRRRRIILDATGSVFVLDEAEAKARGRPMRCTGEAVKRLTRQALDAGVEISAGTDTVSDEKAVWPEVYDEIFFLVRDVGMTPLAAIRSATLVGARAAGLEGDMGVIEPGKLANFVVLAKDPEADIGALRSILFTVKRGRVYQRSAFRPASPGKTE